MITALRMTGAVSDRRSRGIGPAPVIRRAVIIGVSFACVVAALALATRSRLIDNWFNGNSALSLCLILGLFGFCAGHLTRGVLSSHRRFPAYSRFFGADGISRVALAGALAAIGVHAVGLWGVAMVAAVFVGVGVALIGQHGLMEDGPEASWGELTTKLGWLLLGSGMLALVVQSGTIAVQRLATPEQAGAAGEFLNGLTTARIPLFLFQAILASLLPKLSRLAGSGALDEFVGQLRKLVLLILGCGVPATIIAALIGPAFIEKVFGSGATCTGDPCTAPPAMPLTSRDLALLAAAFILIMATICLDQGLIALQGHSHMAIGWTIAFVVFVIVTALGTDLYLRVEMGLLAAGIVAFAWMSLFLRERLRHHARLQPVSEAEALAEIPSP
jgi:O-antigen/teichoic acid export membrane protein